MRPHTRIFSIFFVGLFALAVGLPVLGNDDVIPDVTDRVARISSVDGVVQIRRADTDEWEQVVLNLPIVEGDEIVAEESGKFEIQFDINTHLRASERSVVKIVTLSDAGVAVSLTRGSLAVTASAFDSEKFFEVDAPQTTVALQRAGRYRVDAGTGIHDAEIRVSVSNGGAARVYSETAGFTVGDGRIAKVMTTGRNAGEWDMADISEYADAFEAWVAVRETEISQRMDTAHFDQYYDQDIYGAEDLTSYGTWSHTQDYGYVWRPSSSAIRHYANWSPYQYGHWRWLPAFGWTWVNDEPWGWATYHYGRWIWHHGAWYWSPYAQYRYGRSIWRPALVVLGVWNNRVCWYPLPYYYSYYNYNHNYYRNRPRRPRANQPVPQPTPDPRRRMQGTMPVKAPRDVVPPTGVISVDQKEFGRARGGFTKASDDAATTILAQEPTRLELPILPTYRDVGPAQVKVVPGTVARSNSDSETKTGAAPRTQAAPLDPQLQRSRMLGGRQPVVRTAEPEKPAGAVRQTRTGAVERPVTPVSRTPVTRAPATRSGQKVETPAAATPPFVPPTRTAPQPRNEQPTRNAPARSTPPVRSEPAPTRSTPPARSAPVPTRRSPPARSEPAPTRSTPPARSEPAPSRSADPKPAPSPARGDGAKKDG